MAVGAGVLLGLGFGPIPFLLAIVSIIGLTVSLEGWFSIFLAATLIVPEATPLEKAFRIPGTPIVWYELFFGLLIFRWLVEMAKSRSPLPRTRYTYPLVLFAIIVVFGALRGLLSGHDPRDIASDIHVFFFYLLIPLTRYLYAKSKDGLSGLVFRVTAVAVIASATGALLQLAFASALPDTPSAIGAERILARNDEIFTLTLILAIVAAATARKGRLVFAIAAIVIALKLVLTFSRQPLLALAQYWLILVPLAFLFFRRSLRHLRLRTLAPILVLLVGAVALVLTPQFTSSLAPNGVIATYTGRMENALGADFVEQRLYYAPQFLTQFLSNPLFGTGFGTVFVTVRPEFGIDYASNVFIDNLFMTMLPKVGIVGTAVFLWIFALVLLDAYRLLSRPTPLPLDLAPLAAFAVFTPLLWEHMLVSASLGYFRVIAIVIVFISLLELARVDLSALQSRENSDSQQSSYAN